MEVLSNIGAALFFIAFILLILCIVSFFKKNGKAIKYGRSTAILFMISIVLMVTGTTESEHPVVEFFSILSFILFIFFLVLAILSVIKKTGVAKKQFIITAILFVIFAALSGISNPSSEKTTATNKQVASNSEEKKDDEKKKELEKKEADEKTRKQEDEKRQDEELARKQEDEKRQAEELARKQQEEQQRQAAEQARVQQEQQKAQQAQAQPAAGNNSNTYFKNCTEVKNAGKAPLYRDQPGYSSKLDRDGDGVACEK
ncbi:excalibur calcium-binding domain-containing protein [Bacillus cereus group sp. BfR-BA-01316]|uniref:excalibur calcium-binding domain-containing protein n=1 Tax=Bacillus cereus group sp. BfR-BA-01316 TaxID=2920293 RepID=UPI001F5ACC18|nr:excalibur calcium-binding domain-containing protein [Bacillus cereus group sp. BfR-BA-01316]